MGGSSGVDGSGRPEKKVACSYLRLYLPILVKYRRF